MLLQTIYEYIFSYPVWKTRCNISIHISIHPPFLTTHLTILRKADEEKVKPLLYNFYEYFTYSKCKLQSSLGKGCHYELSSKLWSCQETWNLPPNSDTCIYNLQSPTFRKVYNKDFPWIEERCFYGSILSNQKQHTLQVGTVCSKLKTLGSL